jgi:hypothetical protein
MKINCMRNVEPIEWTKGEVSGVAECRWKFIWYLWVRIAHYNAFILKILNLPHFLLFIHSFPTLKVMWSQQLLTVVTSNQYQLTLTWNQNTLAAYYVKSIHTDWSHMKSVPTDWRYVKSIPTDYSRMKSVTTDCSHMDSTHTDCLSHEASESWLHFTWNQYQMTAVT